MTATSVLLATWSLAFFAHVASSQPPLAAVESSYVFSVTAKLPALPPDCSRSSAMALLVSVEASCEAPWSGRSLAITRGPPAAGAAVPPGAVVAPGAADAAGALVAPELSFESSPHATPTTASAMNSADAFLNLMVLPFVGIFGFSPSVRERGYANWLANLARPHMRPTVRLRVRKRAGTLTGRASYYQVTPCVARRGSDVDDMVSDSDQFFVVTCTNDA